MLPAFFLALLMAVCPLAAQSAVQQNLAPTPPMGWASWNPFFCDYNDQTIRDQADALVSTGMRDLGYRYVLIQECLTSGRNADGSLIVEATRFPHGMKDLVDYVHSRGLKAGIYTDIGENTCAGKPYQGSFRHEDQDAATFAAWGIDFVEMDYCNRPEGFTGRQIYERMAEAIRKTGRPMLLYICSWGNESPWTWAQGTAQLWRTEGDISGEKNHVNWENVVRNFESNARHAAFSAPNSWNDPDMMEVGAPGLTLAEAQTHFSMWAISAAPLWAGNDLTKMDDAIRAIQTNREAISIDQDPLGAGPVKVSEYRDPVEAWAKPLGSLSSGVQAVMLVNLGAQPAAAKVEWADLALAGPVAVRDLWAHKDLGEFSGAYTVQLPSHGSALLKVTGEFDWSHGAEFEAEWPGNIRAGGAVLLPCPECSKGYAVSLRGAKGISSSLTFTHIAVQKVGRYFVNIVYVYSGEANDTVQMIVNHGQPVDVKLPGAIYATARIPVDLNNGDNSIEFRFAAEGTVDIDRMALTR
jgi:alpha-galactosidase